jgi:succinoglycan biosynthesis protein ExoV
MTGKLKLFYWNGGNFGDDLNLWIWKHVLPDVVDTRSPYQRGENGDLFVGIGTLLNEWLPKQNRKLVFGAGVGYGTPNIDETHRIAFVRGPVSAAIIGGDTRYITDPALLIRKLVVEDLNNRKNIVFMPHHESMSSVNWRELCEEMGMVLADPTRPFLETINILNSAKLVIGEAMHAAIVADSMGIPWIPVSLHGHINHSKWNDWCGSVGVDYNPVALPGRLALVRGQASGMVYKKIMMSINRMVARQVFRKILKSGKGSLSNAVLREGLLQRLDEQAEILRHQHATGRLWR